MIGIEKLNPNRPKEWPNPPEDQMDLFPRIEKPHPREGRDLEEATLRGPSGKIIARTKAILISLPGYDGHPFFLHRSITPEDREENFYTVSEGQTGCYIACGADAIEAAQSALEELREKAPTLDKLRACIQDRIDSAYPTLKLPGKD